MAKVIASLTSLAKFRRSTADGHDITPSAIRDGLEFGHFLVQFVLDVGSFLEDHRNGYYAGHHGHYAQANGRRSGEIRRSHY